MVNSQGGRAEGHISVRLPSDLYRQLKAGADAADRPLSVEIIERLRQSLVADANPPPPEPSIADLEKRLAAVEQSVMQWMFTWSPEQEARLDRIETKIGRD